MVVIREYDGYVPVANDFELGHHTYGNKISTFIADSPTYTIEWFRNYKALFKYGVVCIEQSRPFQCAALLTQKNGVNVVFINTKFRNYMPIKNLIKGLKADHSYSNKNFKYVDYDELRKFFYNKVIPARHIVGTYLINKLLNECSEIQLDNQETAGIVSEVASI